MTPDTDLAALLAGHWSASTHTDRKPYVDKCDGCGAVILEWGQPVPSDSRLWLAAHQAAVVRAAGWVKGREEWGIRWDTGLESWRVDEADARATHTDYPDLTTVIHRYAGKSDWEEA